MTLSAFRPVQHNWNFLACRGPKIGKQVKSDGLRDEGRISLSGCQRRIHTSSQCLMHYRGSPVPTVPTADRLLALASHRREPL